MKKFDILLFFKIIHAPPFLQKCLLVFLQIKNDKINPVSIPERVNLPHVVHKAKVSACSPFDKIPEGTSVPFSEWQLCFLWRHILKELLIF